ncbi:5' exonuclease Apollo isoform X2 [Abrus precatorius]|uniref:5' exonuclease Apollo isoform X2 n=1 Tax=Abrus precatorius TaxID=3816 RepID=A0A8B8M162_ABRPR|nr:5' exonuclease Apollo isoform X2 [Abrus precatorius]
MPIEMPKGLPFSVDTWSPSSKSSKRHHFLTHAHKDHSSSITSHASFPIYSTLLTKTLILQHYPHLLSSFFLPIEVGQSLTIHDPAGAFTVTAFDANHCPGAVMFLFEGIFGNILHTGDCRLTPECLLNLPDKYVGRKGREPRFPLDCVFLDCTFANFSQGMPTKHSAIQHVINCIWKHPDAPTVYLTCDMLGQEEILVNVSQTFGDKIYVDRAKNPDCLKNLCLNVPEILCEDPSSRFHLFDGSPRLYERAKAKMVEAKATLQPLPLIIRPSAQWYVCEEEFSEIENTRKKRMNEAVKDQFGVWHVCYSMHSSKEELEWALQLLAPRWVVSTTPSCRAMELDYVKKHCFNSKGALNNSVRKLLDMIVETSDGADTLVNSARCYPVLEGTPQPFTQTKSPIKQCVDAKVPEELSLHGKSLPITTFGRARLSLQDVGVSRGGSDMLPVNVLSQKVSSDTRQEFLNDMDDVEVKEGSPERNNDLHPVEKHHQSEVQEGTRVNMSTSYLNIGSSGLSGSVIKLYRSRNVSVPQPLPSLAGLMKSIKRVKRGIDY